MSILQAAEMCHESENDDLASVHFPRRLFLAQLYIRVA